MGSAKSAVMTPAGERSHGAGGQIELDSKSDAKDEMPTGLGPEVFLLESIFR